MQSRLHQFVERPPVPASAGQCLARGSRVRFITATSSDLFGLVRGRQFGESAVLSPERDPPRHSAAAGPRRGHSCAAAAVSVRLRGRTGSPPVHRHASAARRASVAGQSPGAASRRRDAGVARPPARRARRPSAGNPPVGQGRVRQRLSEPSRTRLPRQPPRRSARRRRILAFQAIGSDSSNPVAAPTIPPAKVPTMPRATAAITRCASRYAPERFGPRGRGRRADGPSGRCVDDSAERGSSVPRNCQSRILNARLRRPERCSGEEARFGWFCAGAPSGDAIVCP